MSCAFGRRALSRHRFPRVSFRCVTAAGIEIAGSRCAAPDEHFLACPDSGVPAARGGTAFIWQCYPPRGSGDISAAAVQITPLIGASPDDELRACPRRRVSDSAEGCVLRGKRCPCIRFWFIKRACLQELSVPGKPSPYQHLVAYPDGGVACAGPRRSCGRDGFPRIRYRRVDTTGVERLLSVI